MSRIRIAELQLHQEIENEGMRESMRTYADNTRNLQQQIDLMDTRLQIIEVTNNLSDENYASSTSAADLNSLLNSLIFS